MSAKPQFVAHRRRRSCGRAAQLFDQFWHGRRVEELGVGVMVTRPTKIAAAVAKVTVDGSYAKRARGLGEKLRRGA